MKRLIVSLVLLGMAQVAAAQPLATTVQLPTFQFFTTSTTISVPDSGAGLLGRRPETRWGSTAYGPNIVPWRMTSGSVTGPMTTVTATIHDLPALDRATLARAGGGEASTTAETASTSNSAGRDSSTAAAAPAGSLAELRRARQAEIDERDREAREWLARAEEARRAGKLSLALSLTKLALSKASPGLQAEIRAALQTPPAIEPPLVSSPR